MRQELLVVRKNPDQITEFLSRKVSDFYREMFDEKHFLVFPDTLEILGKKEVFNPGKMPHPLIEDAVLKMPRNPNTGSFAVRWHHPEATYRIIDAKLREPGTITWLLLDPHTEKLYGLVIIEMLPFQRFMESNCWLNPLGFAGRMASAEHSRSAESILEQINHSLEKQWRENGTTFLDGGKPRLSMDEMIVSPNCVAVHKDARSMEAQRKLYSCFWSSFREDHEPLKFVQESLWQSKVTQLCTYAGMVEIDGTLHSPDVVAGPGDTVILVGDYGAIRKIANIYDLLEKNAQKEKQDKLDRAAASGYMGERVDPQGGRNYESASQEADVRI